MARRNEHPCASVEFVEGRWDVAIILRDASGEKLGTWIASADSYLTFRDGIYFATEEEYDKATA